MHIAFRVDSSTIIGYGHVMRCLTLAHALVCEVKSVQKESVDEDFFVVTSSAIAIS
jgi:spore coat polysaccharide biosynthesis predicted glycosyltransferase SpsG